MLVPAIARVGGNVITLALVVPLLFRGHGAATVATVIVLAAAARVGFQAVAACRLRGFELPAPEPPSWRSLLRAGFPFLTANGLALFVARVDVVILGQLAGAAAVGWYGAASRLVEAFYFLPVLLTTATFPVLSRLWSEDKSEFHATVRKTLDLLIVLIVPLSVTFFILAENIVGSLFTLESYSPSVPLLRIQAVSLALIFVDYLLTCILLATGRERTWIAILGAACLVNPALNFVLIPATSAAYANGAIGAAFATLLTEIFILVCALRVVAAGTFDAGSVRIAVRAAALGGLLALVLLVSRPLGIPWIVAAAIGGAGYFAAVVRLGLLPADVKAWVGDLVRRRRSVALSTVSTELDAA
jgi:O-antigen/teichoic acid export membrane protein